MKRALIVLAAVALTVIASTAQAQSVSMLSPISQAYINNMRVRWSISTASQTINRITMTWTYSSGYYASSHPGPFVLTLNSTSATGDITFSILNDLPPTTTTYFSEISPSGTTWLPDGSYAVKITAELSGGNVSSTTANLSISTITIPAAVTSPAQNSRHSRLMRIQYTLPSSPRFSGYPVHMMFDGPVHTNLALSSTQNVSFDLDTTNLASNAVYVRAVWNDTFIDSGVGPTSLPDGLYTVTLRYTDSVNHAPADTIISNVRVQTSTPTPTITLPVSDTAYGTIEVNYTLPSDPMANSASVTFNPGAYTFALTDTVAGSNTFTWPSETPLPPDGAYTVTVSYRDFLENAAASASALDVRYQFQTPTPTLTAPTEESMLSVIPIAFTLPDAPSAGSVTLTLSGANIGSFTLTDTMTQSFTLNPSAPQLSSSIVSGTLDSLSDGYTTFTLSYQDAFGHPAATSDPVGVFIKTRTNAPTLAQPVAATVYSTSLPIAYVLPDRALPSSVQLTFIGPSTTTFTMIDSTPASTVFIDPTALPSATMPFVSRTGDSALSPGMYTVVLSYQDSIGNAAATAEVENVIISAPTLSISPVSASDASGMLEVPVTLADLHGDVSVNYATADGTARAGVNYAETSGTLFFSASDSTKYIQVPLLDDERVTGDLSLTITLSAASGATIETPTATLTIIDSNIASVHVEQTGGVTRVAEGATIDTFSIALSTSPNADVTVTMNGGSLLTLMPNAVTFTPESWSTPQTVTITGPALGTLSTDEVAHVTFATTSSDSFYQGLSVESLNVSISHIVDNDAGAEDDGGEIALDMNVSLDDASTEDGAIDDGAIDDGAIEDGAIADARPTHDGSAHNGDAAPDDMSRGSSGGCGCGVGGDAERNGFLMLAGIGVLILGTRRRRSCATEQNQITTR